MPGLRNGVGQYLWTAFRISKVNSLGPDSAADESSSFETKSSASQQDCKALHCANPRRQNSQLRQSSPSTHATDGQRPVT
eukprot:7316023-Pyramimonas_sp.AAC.1